MMSRHSSALFAVALATAVLLPAGAAAQDGVSLERTVVPATGIEASVLTAERFGRFAVFAESTQGTAIQVVDRMMGPGPVYGSPGAENGRVDLFLERGEYKILAHSHRDGSGEARLSVVPFEDLHVPRAPRLVELRPVETTLGDFQQRSYWIDLSSKQDVAFEAVGRHLRDLRLWRDGSWLLAAEPSCGEVEPVTGQPQGRCQLVTTLEPGLYLLTAYGGPSSPWAEASEEEPLYLRWGIERLGSAGRQRFVLGPTGTDRWIVPDGPSYFRVALPENAPVTLAVNGWSPSNPYPPGGTRARITDESRVPVAEVRTYGSGWRVVTVNGPPGQPYVLQHFAPFSRSRTLSGDGTYYVTTLHGAFDTDEADPTGFLYRGTTDRMVLGETRVLPLDRKHGYERRFNLTEDVTLVLEVTDEARYAITAEDTRASLRLEPLLLTRPPHYEPPPFREHTWDETLAPGFYLLTVHPIDPGIVTLSARADTWMGRVRSAVGAEGPEPIELRPALQFPRLSIDRGAPQTLVLSDQSGIPTGLVFRELPADLADPLPMTLMPAEELEVRARVAEGGTLFAVMEDGEPLPVKVGDHRWDPTPEVGAGTFTVHVRNTAKHPVHATLGFRPTRTDPRTPLPPLSEGRLETLPEFPVLTAGTPAFLDLDRTSSETFLVRVDAPALYQLQTTGLLATEGALRTRTRIGFARGTENGVGRNFLVARYLREGDYQVTVGTRGQTRGHLGLELDRTELVHGGALIDGVPARVTLPEDHAVAYTFAIAEEGDYRLQSFGRGRTFDCRLEDEDGWPLTDPVISCDTVRRFAPGAYRVIVLPQRVPTKRITRLSRVTGAQVHEGHGPHALPWGIAVSHTWFEPEHGGDRVPDVWTFEVPAMVSATVLLSDEMSGEVLRVGGEAAERVGRLVPGRAWREELTPGQYRVEIRGARKNNGIPYTISVRTRELIAGQQREVGLPETLQVSVGSRSLVDIGSFGTVDVRARLFDERGALVASNDDRPDDWNFAVSERLDPGRYTLRLDPVGDAYGSTLVSMAAPEEIEDPPLAVGEVRTFDPGRAVHHLPLSLPRGEGLVVVSALSGESIGTAVEGRVNGTWQSLGETTGAKTHLAVRRPVGEVVDAYRVRAWSLDQRGNPVTLSVSAPEPVAVGEARLVQGVSLRPERSAALAVVAVGSPTPGLFELEGPRTGLLVCPTPGRACAVPRTAIVSATADGLWLASEGGSARARRIVAAPGAETLAPVPAAGTVVLDVAEGSGPLAIIARSPAGQPAVHLIGNAARESTEADPRAMAVSRTGALAVDLEGKRNTAVLWSSADAPLDVRVTPVRFETSAWDRSDWGITDGTLAPGEARALKLRGPSRDVRLGLERGLVAVFEDGPNRTAVRWADDRALDEEVRVASDRITLLNPTGAPALYTIEVLPARTDAPPVLTAERPFEQIAVRRGTLRIPVEADAEGTVQVRGNLDEVVYVTAEGRVHRGRTFSVGRGGTLEIHHGSGPLLAWVEHPGSAGPWAKVASPRAVPVTGAEQVVLSGIAASLQVDLEGEGMLHLAAPCPLVARIVPAGGSPRIEVRDRGGRIDAWLPEGTAEVTLRSLEDTVLWGTVEVTHTRPVDIGEGLGPEVLLSPGSTRLFRFRVTEDGPIGVGVSADADRVDAVVLDAAGSEVTRGLVQMPSLTPGTWFLALHLPAELSPVRARPALAGVERPDTGPPDEVVRRYLAAAGLVEGGTK